MNTTVFNSKRVNCKKKITFLFKRPVKVSSALRQSADQYVNVYSPTYSDSIRS